MPRPSPRPLVLLAHGTGDPAGRATLEAIAEAARQRLPGVDVRLGFVDVIEPAPGHVLAGTTGAVVVPLFLASGYHVNVDVPLAVAAADGARATSALGPDPALSGALLDRLHAASDLRSSASIVLAAAGSSNAGARAEVGTAAQALAAAATRAVTVGFLSGTGPSVGDAVDEALSGGGAVAVASYLLAPGHFQSRLERLGAERDVPVSAALGAHDRVVDVVLRRYAGVRPALSRDRVSAT